MLRSRIIFFIAVILLLVLALPAIARADETVEDVPTEIVVPATEPLPDGWTWDEVAPAAEPAPDGWSWDEATAPG